MLVTTVWMMADDNNRPWKDYQRKFERLDTWTTASPDHRAESADFETTLDELEDDLAKAQRDVHSAGPSSTSRDSFDRDKQFADEFARLVKQTTTRF